MRHLTADELNVEPVPGKPGYVRKRTDKGQRGLFESEAAFEIATEHYLDGLGYRRMTAQNMTPLAGERWREGGPCVGFYAHMHRAKGNPFLPDLVLVSWPAQRPPLLLELKNGQAATYQPGQKVAISIGLWRVAFDMADVVRIVGEWDVEIYPARA